MRSGGGEQKAGKSKDERKIQAAKQHWTHRKPSCGITTGALTLHDGTRHVRVVHTRITPLQRPTCSRVSKGSGNCQVPRFMATARFSNPLYLGLLGGDAVQREATLAVVQQAEVLVGLGNGNDI